MSASTAQMAQNPVVNDGDRNAKHFAHQASLVAFAVPMPQAIMPWDKGLLEDNRFRKWMLHGFGICSMLAALVTFMPSIEKPVIDRNDKREQYAKLVIEEKVIPKAPEPVIEKPKPKKAEPKKPEVKKKEAKKPVLKPEPKAQPKVEKKVEPPKPTEAELRAKAREKAANSGLLALSDELSAIRQKSSTSSVKNMTTGVTEAKQVKRKLLAANMGNTLSANASISQQQNNVGLSGRESTDIVISTEVVEALSANDRQAGQGQQRSADEVRRVMDANKGAIYSVYNRALRKNPSLQGTLTFSMTIEPSGVISQVNLETSELNDATLEKRLLSRIRMIRFEEADVLATQVNYSFDFLPY